MKSLLPRRLRREIEHPIESFQREMNRLVDSFFGPEMPAIRGEWAPLVDVSETENEILVKADVPGMTADDINVTLAGNVLTISGEKKDERKETKGGYSIVERRSGKFQRSVTLPSGIDGEKAQAEFKNGVLSITIPKTEETRAKKIPVKGEKQLA
ncbi:MAG TPA: Hsp20/alpha crystallin family protein [Planctomycetota bacterium]|nr:Hsp20/alpha crystallin family protein [Planctomycetota bacterium]